MDRKIRILIIPTSGLQREGITLSQLEYVKRLDKSRFSISVAAVHNNARDVMDEFESFGCSVIPLPDRKNKKAFLQYCSALKKEMDTGYDIVHVHGNSASIAVELAIARHCGIKVRIAHSRNTRCEHEKLDRLLRPMLYRNYTYALACGKEAGEWLFPGRDAEVFHNGKDFSRFCFDAEQRRITREELNLTGKVVYGHAGHFSAQKNHSFLIDIFAEIQKHQENAVLYLMGDGPLMQDIREKVRAMDLEQNVVFAGRINDAYRRLAAMDVMVFPSLLEGLPNVVLEWQAEGLPCLISDRITKECALSPLVHFMPISESPDTWARKAISLQIPDEKRKQESVAAIQTLTDNGFEIRENTEKLEELYRKLVKRAEEACGGNTQ